MTRAPERRECNGDEGEEGPEEGFRQKFLLLLLRWQEEDGRQEEITLVVALGLRVRAAS